jgi:cytochrome c oxidase cbb3-type subunit 1
LVFAASPAVYPPVDRTTGGPTGSSLLGSSLLVVGLMLILPRVTALARPGRKSVWIWVFFGVSWLVFGVTEAMGGTHFEVHQIISMLFLLPWVWWLPRDWAGFEWPDGSRFWRGAMFGWWGVLVVSGLLMYQAGVLDRLKFTQGLVAHSHLAMAGFTTSFCALLLVLITGKRIGSGLSVGIWHVATLAMIVTLASMGWREGGGPAWMLEQPAWRELGLWIRSLCGLMMFGVSVSWWMKWRTL